jgi:hypothetical protein
MPLLSKSAAVIIVIKRELNLVLSQWVTLMNDQNCITSACRYCRFYRPEGSHGGACQQLNVSVRSDWKACQLGLPAFANSWENAEQLAIANRQVEPQQIESQENITVVASGLSHALLSNNN